MARFLVEYLRVFRSAVFHEVPLVRDDDDAAARAVGFAADRGVLLRRAGARVDDQRDDVRVYAPEERDQLMASLRRGPETLVFVKSDHYLDDFLRELPGALEFVPEGRQGGVAVGWVRPRREPPSHLLAVQEARSDRLLE